MRETNFLELHYYLDDNSHSMNALVQNKSEAEILYLIKEICDVLNINIIIETEALAEGGIRRWFKLTRKDERKNLTYSTAICISLITAVVTTPLTVLLTKSTEILIEKIFEDDIKKQIEQLELEGVKLSNEEKALNIKLKKIELTVKIQEVEDNYKIKKRKSNFYEELRKDNQVHSVSFLLEDINKKPISKELIVIRQDFNKHVLETDKIDTEPIDDAVIEIISPVLKKGKYKWKGLYNSKPISFFMKSNEFKTLVQTGKVEFKNGSSINCLLDIIKVIDNEGNERIESYSVLRVNSYFEHDKSIETGEGKKIRQQKEADEGQYNMF
ncbi:hypothetical protein [uncultured Gelidibacter sp.]|uniref:hypothetical protein n=1 Tax=uncultured Gelidibacter sp. TaxID=259318 RepID=UPI00262BC005|nr:hypothetical protein [uncultured Gelidibacter sp.]